MTRNRPAGTPGLTDEDLALWRNATRADSPLRGGDRPPEAEAETGPAVGGTAPPRRRGDAAAAPNGTDKRTRQRLRRGQYPIQARIDLHGMTQEEARRALDRAVAGAWARGDRCLLVITGKGATRGASGVLRRMAPRWLAEQPNAGRALAVETALPRDGGDGALYVLIRRRRTDRV